MIDNILEKYWFSKKEIAIYKSCYANGPMNAINISRTTKINRTTVYSVINEMISKWYITEVLNNKIKRFSASTPSVLQSLAENKVNLIAVNKQAFETLLPGIQQKNKIKSYTWKNGVMSMYKDLLTSETEVLSFLWSLPEDPEIIKYIEEIFYPEKRKKRITSKTLISPSIILPDKEKDSMNLRERRQKIELPTNSIINLYGPGKIMLVEFTKHSIFWTIIENQKMHESFCSIFKYIWNS